MPCYSTIRMSVDFKASSITLLRAALEAEGYTVSQLQDLALSFRHANTGVSGTWRDGKLNITEGADINAIRASYSKAAVKEAGRRCGWTYTPGGNHKATMERRY